MCDFPNCEKVAVAVEDSCYDAENDEMYDAQYLCADHCDDDLPYSSKYSASPILSNLHQGIRSHQGL